MELPELSLGGSLPVPSVQEMVKEPIPTVPHRYLHFDQEPPAAKGISVPAIPIIDMQKLLRGESVADELQRLHSASKEWGFFQLINHGISSSLIQEMKFEVQRFFRLPLEEKERFFQLPGDIQGYGQAFVFSEEQKLDWGDMFSLITLPTNLRKSHLFERLSPSFRETMEAYGLEMQMLALTVLGLIAKALGMEPEEMTSLFEDGLQSIRMSYYPPCPQPVQAIGLSPHSDAGGITILLQVNEVQGLEVRKDGKWVPIEPLQDALIVNIADLLEIVTNGTYESVLHRATVNSDQERLSVATFYSPKLKAVIGPAASLISAEKPALFKKVVVEDYIKGLYSGELKGKRLINTVKISS
ncbi:oxoglutarate-dependent flavonoid 7-O-demethylase 1-like [Aristolochia californica]|uniref:oxoglutarate-dependent flavonoid 7-O-demethylase 1-like n=1 Tax=Aristolochia californica TaxID=171875 RepID=UPI0035E05B3C